MVFRSQAQVNHSNLHPSDAVESCYCKKTGLLDAQAGDCTSNHQLLNLLGALEDGVSIKNMNVTLNVY